MTTLLHRRLTSEQLNELIDTSPREAVSLTDDHRRSLTSRFRAVSATQHRRLDAWAVEQAGRPATPFTWRPSSARRAIGNAALRRYLAAPTKTMVGCVEEAIDDQLLRAASGYARAGSLASWLTTLSRPVHGLLVAEAVNWATQFLDVADGITSSWQVPASDAYYDVAAARTTLRARRDLVVLGDRSRVVLRLRGGAPGKSAGPGLRADLTIDTLANLEGVAPSRFIGLWPDAGVMLCVDATMEDLRAGARDLVRTAVVQRRTRLSLAA
jgi:hypothetical protein